MWVLYSVVGVFVVSIADYANRMRSTIGYVMGMRLGHVERIRTENEELRHKLDASNREREIASNVVGNLVFDKSRPEDVLPVTKNYMPYDPIGEHQQCINDALLIFDTAKANNGRGWSREAMEGSGKITQDRWKLGIDWLMSARVLERTNRKTAVWRTTDRNIVHAMLVRYGKTAKG